MTLLQQQSSRKHAVRFQTGSSVSQVGSTHSGPHVDMLGTLKADSHIPCRSHAVPMPFPCRLEGQFTHTMPFPCRSPAVLKASSHIPCRSPAVLKADSHKPCRSHAVPMPFPCRSHAVPTPFSCHSHATTLSLPCPSPAISFQQLSFTKLLS
jgi:hypothetical protein